MILFCLYLEIIDGHYSAMISYQIRLQGQFYVGTSGQQSDKDSCFKLVHIKKVSGMCTWKFVLCVVMVSCSSESFTRRFFMC